MDERINLLASARKHVGYVYQGTYFLMRTVLLIVGVVGGVFIVGLLLVLPSVFADGSGNNLWLLFYAIHLSIIGYFIGKGMAN